jgi:branched-chain amino acid transport system permease protein
MSNLLQFTLAGITSGAIYALIGLGFSIIFNSSRVINLAQGEFVTIGGIVTAALVAKGIPAYQAILIAVVSAAIVGILIEKFAIEPVRTAPLHTIIMITVGLSIFLQGLIQVVFGKGVLAVATFSGDRPLMIGTASIAPQSLWVLGTAILCLAIVAYFFSRTRWGKAMLAASQSREAAELVGIDSKLVLMMSFLLAAILGGIAGAVSAPITMSTYDTGVMLGLKGFVAATLGGLGSGPGAVVGGLLLGIIESLAAGYVSSNYRDAFPILILMPNGVFGLRHSVDRV